MPRARPISSATTRTLGEQLDRRGIAIDAIRDKVAAFHVAIPSWGVGTGGTRFARFPGDGEPRDIFDKIEDCAVIQQLTRATPTVSLHIPWDKADPEPAEAGGLALRPRLRRDELQHLLRRQGPEAFLQVRLAEPRRRRHAQAGGRAQSRMHRDRQDARLQGADGVDRRRLEFSRPGQFHQGLRALSRIRCARSMPTCPTTGGCSPSTRCTSRPSIRRSCRTGAPTTSSPRSSAPRPIASSTSATMRRTSTSR